MAQEPHKSIYEGKLRDAAYYAITDTIRVKKVQVVQVYPKVRHNDFKHLKNGASPDRFSLSGSPRRREPRQRGGKGRHQAIGGDPVSESTFKIAWAAAYIRPVGAEESATFKDVVAGQVLTLPTSGAAGVRQVRIFGRERRLGPGRYEVDLDAGKVQVLRPPSSGIVTVHWVSHHRWHKVQEL